MMMTTSKGDCAGLGKGVRCGLTPEPMINRSWRGHVSWIIILVDSNDKLRQYGLEGQRYETVMRV